MAKRMQQAEGAEEEPAAKRRRALRASGAAAAAAAGTETHKQGAASRRRSPWGGTAAAAAAGWAESEGGKAADSKAEEHSSPEHHSIGASREVQVGGKCWHGVRTLKQAYGKAYRARIKMPKEGGGAGKHVELGTHGTQEEAARVHDLALIAVLGRKAVAASSLNFPLAEYPNQEAFQRFGPDLHAYLLQLSGGKEEQPKKKRAQSTGGTKQKRLAGLEKARAQRRANLGRTSAQAEALVGERRSADPLWCPPYKPCGVCPACRQPWRTDLGCCVRLAAFRAAGHKEDKVVKLLAADPGYVAALHTEKQEVDEQQQQSPAVAQPSRRHQQLQGAGQRSPAMVPSARSPPAVAPEREPNLEWLELPAKASQGNHRLQRLQREALALLRQQLGWSEVQFAAALEREQQRGVPRPAVGAPATAAAAARPKGCSSGRGGSGNPSAFTVAVTDGHGQQVADPMLVDPFSWLARADPPRNVLHGHEDPMGLLQLAALCRDGGTEAPLSAEAAEELLEEEGERQEEEQRVLRRRQCQQQQQQQQQREEVEGSHGGGSRAQPPAGDCQSAAPCLLCGSARHGQLGLRGCPVAQMALAVPKQPPESPEFAHKEQLGYKVCLGPHGARANKGTALGQPFVRRAPWMDRLPPATRQFMLAAQEFSSAAVADLGAPAAAWKLTPKALLAVGLLAEEIARREVAARFGGGVPATC